MDCVIYFVSLASLCLFHSVSAGCVQSIESDQGYGQCLTGYSLFMGNAISSVDASDQMAMVSVVCSKEGKAAMKCVLDYLKTCPDLMVSDDPVKQSIFQAFSVMDKLGGFETYCSMLSGPCSAVQKCISDQQFEADTAPMSAPPTPFSMIQLSVKGLCGPLKQIFECFKDVGNKCPELEETIKIMSKMSNMTQSPSGMKIPSYENSKEFVKKCANLPKDFATNKCVMNNLKSEEFVSCYENITRNHPTQESRRGCDAYRDGHKCLSMSVGEKCGSKYTEAFVVVTPMFLDIPTNCKLETSPNTSSLVHVSVATLLAALFAVFKMV